MRREPAPPPPSWQMEVFEVVPGLFIATRFAAGTEYRTLGVDAIVDLEDWEDAWTPPVPSGSLYVCLRWTTEMMSTRKSQSWQCSSPRS